jgi:hypothetical protein
MTQIIELGCPMFISKLEGHDEHKEYLLSLIDQMPQSSIKANDIISKTDWNLDENVDQPYLNFIKPKLVEHITKTFQPFNYSGISFTKFWFQQYTNGDTHKWHVHSSCHFTNVYFLELPDPSFRTEIHTWNRSRTIDYKVKEGDVITFPSIFYHRSPINYSKLKKTIISFNVDLLSSDQINV